MMLRCCRVLHPAKWLILMAVVFHVVASRFDQEDVYKEVPGDIAALTNGPVYLNWTTSLSIENILWCYWEWSECRTCPNKEFIGYYQDAGGRQNISSRHTGWEFVSKESPCLGGLYRANTKPEHIGWYRMVILTDPRNSYRSELSGLQLYNESDLVIKIQVDNSTQNIALKDGKGNQIILAPKTKTTNRTADIKLEVDHRSPEATIVSVTKRNNIGVNFIINNCIGPARRSCEFEVLLGEEKDVNITAVVNTGIQGYPVVIIKQAFLYDGTNVSHSSTKDGVSRQTFIGLVTVAVCLFVTFIVVVLWLTLRKKHTRLPQNDTNNNEQCTSNDPERESSWLLRIELPEKLIQGMMVHRALFRPILCILY